MAAGRSFTAAGEGRQPRPLHAFIRSTLAVLAAAAIGLATVGCGYALVGRGSNIPDDVKVVYLRAFENRTQRVEVEQFITQAIADELVTRQRFALSRDEAQADAILRGAVIGFQVVPITFDAQGRAEEYEISITAEVAFERAGSDTVLWRNDRYQFRENYIVEVSEQAFFDRENLAIEETAAKFAETMVTDLLEGF